jgi:hypothetical protein
MARTVAQYEYGNNILGGGVGSVTVLAVVLTLLSGLALLRVIEIERRRQHVGGPEPHVGVAVLSIEQVRSRVVFRDDSESESRLVIWDGQYPASSGETPMRVSHSSEDGWTEFRSVFDRSYGLGEFSYELVGWKHDMTQGYRDGVDDSLYFHHRDDAVFVGDHIHCKSDELGCSSPHVRNNHFESQRKHAVGDFYWVSKNLNLNTEPRAIRILDCLHCDSGTDLSGPGGIFHRRRSAGGLSDRIGHLIRLPLRDFVHLLDGPTIRSQREAHHVRLMPHNSELAFVDVINSNRENHPDDSGNGLENRRTNGPPIVRRGIIAVALTWFAFGTTPRVIGWRNRRRGRQVTNGIGIGLAASYALLLVTLWPATWGWWL